MERGSAQKPGLPFAERGLLLALVAWGAQVFQYDSFSLSDMVRCSADLRRVDPSAPSMEAAAQHIVRFFHESFIDKDSGEPATVLARCYVTMPYDELDDSAQRVARQSATHGGTFTGINCLALLASAGERPEWCDRLRSVGHLAIPLGTRGAVTRLPMVAALFQQLGLGIDELVAGASPDRSGGLREVFHVADALGDPAVPAQDEFVIPFGIRSVLGFGGLLPDGRIFTVILFTRVEIPTETAERFRLLAISVELALLRFAGRPLLTSQLKPGVPSRRTDEQAAEEQLALLGQLLDASEDAAVEQALRLENALADAHDRADLAAKTQTALAESEARHAAVISGSLDAIVSIDMDGAITEFNPAAEAIFGVSRNDAIAQQMADILIPPSLRRRHRAGFDAYLAGRAPRVLGRRVELVGLRRDGTEFPLELTIIEIKESARPGFTAFIRDLTDRREAEAAVRESQARVAAVAQTLQESLLPTQAPDIAGIDVVAWFHPAGDGSEVGGDFYDMIPHSEDVFDVVVGDVCGKGAAAAAVTAMVKYSLRAVNTPDRSPSELLQAVNAVMTGQVGDRYCTVVMGRLRRLADGAFGVTMARAGHPPPLLLSSTGAVAEVGVPGHPLGLFPDPVLMDSDLVLEPGQALFLYTDGLTDARSGDDHFGDGELFDLAGRIGDRPAARIVELFGEAALAHAGGSADDDIALVALAPAATGR